MTVWVIRTGWHFEAVELVKRTAQTVAYIDTYGGKSRQSRSASHKFLDWEGDEATASRLVEKLTSAKAERNRRVVAANTWFDVEQAKLIGGAA